MRKSSFTGGVACLLLLVVSGCGGGAKQAPTPTAAPAAPAKQTLDIGRNIVRVPGLSAADVAAASVLSSYDPAQTSVRPEGFVLIPDDSWQDAVLGSQFAAAPVSAGLLAINRDYIPPAPGDVLGRIKPRGFPKADGLKVIVLDKAGSDVYVDLQDLDLKPTALTGTPAKLAATLVPFRGGWAGNYSDSIVVVSSEARDYALPAAAWSAYSGDTIAFVTRDAVPSETRKLLVQREKLRLRKPSIYVIGPDDVVSTRVTTQLARYGNVQRIAGRDPVETAIALARFHDPATGFGWGLKHGPASVSLLNVRDAANAVGALNFAASGPQAPLLLTDDSGALPDAVTKYLQRLRGKHANQAYVFGGADAIGAQAIGTLDDLLDAGS